jgi:hypothetical protein
VGYGFDIGLDASFDNILDCKRIWEKRRKINRLNLRRRPTEFSIGVALMTV